jgi:16S rRNA (uracil1498-N3)-methyltransferase
MLPRFYVPLLHADSGDLALPPDEAAHLVRVLRLGPGAAVRVFDGRGLERLAVVTRTTKTIAEVRVGEEVLPAPEPRHAVTLGQALLKADKFDDVVRDATMLGVCAIRPLWTSQTDVPVAAVRDGGRVDRWRRVAVASVKQCGRAVVPAVEPVADLAACLAADSSTVRVMLAEPSLAGAAVASPEQLSVPADASVLVLVGPEGGWAADEVKTAVAAGCRVVTLGHRTLRADAAPIVALSVLMHVMGDL